MSEELINEIVSNDTLGIKKKPSLLKIAFTVIVLLIAGSMSYAFYMKNQAEVIQPKLDLGAPLPIAAAPVQPIKPAIEPEPNASTSDATFGQVSTNNPVQPAPAVSPIPNPVTVPSANLPAPVAAAPANPIAPVNTLPAQTTNVPVTNAPQANQLAMNAATPITKPTQNPVTTAVAEQALLSSEVVVNTPIEKKVIKRSPKKKVAVQKAKAANASEETPTQAIPIEEGVTREEIIVIQ